MEYKLCRADKGQVSQIAEMEQILFSDPWSEKGILEETENEYSDIYVALCEENVVGYCIVIRSYDEADIVRIGVSPDKRRLGIASAILSKVFGDLKDVGVEYFNLEVRKDNLSARNLYEKTGFVFVGYRPGFYSFPKEDAAVYRYENKGK